MDEGKRALLLRAREVIMKASYRHVPFPRWLCVVVVLCLAITAGVNGAWGQASLASEDRIDEIPVTVDGVEEAFTVIRDANIENQWYYMPDRPRLFERTLDGLSEPEFALIRYQFRDPENPQDMLEGGLLQFAASLAVPVEALTQLKAAIQAQTGDNLVRLSAMPFKEAKVNIFTPEEGNLIAAAAQGAGIAPAFATQKMAFSVYLTRIGSDIYDTITDGNTGVPIVVEYSFNGLTPPAGFKVEIDWDQTYDYYSKNQKFAAAASWKGLVGGSVDIDTNKIRTTLETNKCITVIVTEGESLTAEQIDKHLEPILARINQEIIEATKPPEKIDPAIATKPDAKAKFYSAGYSVALKDVETVKKGKEVIDFNVRQHQVRMTTAAGFIGIGRYPEEMRKRLVTVVPEGPWKSAFFVLPAVGDAADLGIAQVDLEIGIAAGEDVRQTQVVAWTPETGWRDRRGTTRTVLSFALLGLEASGFDLANAVFDAKTKITLSRDVIELFQRSAIFDGETAVTTPLSAVDVVSVDGSILNWNRIDETSDLAAVTVRMKSGDRTLNTTLKPRRIDGDWIEPAPVYWLVKKNAPVTAEIKFIMKDGRRIDWPENGQRLGEDLGSLDVFLLDPDL